jgi:hypothetical protein
VYERRKTINNKTYYSTALGGQAYELVGGEYVKTDKYVFPAICTCPDKPFPMHECKKCTSASLNQ